jgi:hypothetical protein
MCVCVCVKSLDLLILYIPLYYCLSEDGVHLPKHGAGIMYMDNL